MLGGLHVITRAQHQSFTVTCGSLFVINCFCLFYCFRYPKWSERSEKWTPRAQLVENILMFQTQAPSQALRRHQNIRTLGIFQERALHNSRNTTITLAFIQKDVPGRGDRFWYWMTEIRTIYAPTIDRRARAWTNEWVSERASERASEVHGFLPCADCVLHVQKKQCKGTMTRKSES